MARAKKSNGKLNGKKPRDPFGSPEAAAFTSFLCAQPEPKPRRPGSPAEDRFSGQLRAAGERLRARLASAGL